MLGFVVEVEGDLVSRRGRDGTGIGNDRRMAHRREPASGRDGRVPSEHGISAKVRLSERTTFKIGGEACEYHEPQSIEEFLVLLERLSSDGREPFILGGGANVLFPDGSYSRPVVSTTGLNEIRVLDERMEVGAGVRLNALIRSAINAGLGGLEVFVGIPGTCGGAVTMNAGGRGWTFGQRVESLLVVPREGGKVVRLKGAEVDWTYRSSNLGDAVVLSATLKLRADHPRNLRCAAGDFMRRKVATQPYHTPSAGCIFRNPEGASAGELIERLGMKGYACGGARISSRHANFIINETGVARSEDVKQLIQDVRARVAREFGIRLETEVVFA